MKYFSLVYLTLLCVNAICQTNPRSAYTSAFPADTATQNTEIVQDTTLGPFIYKYYFGLYPNEQKIQTDTSLNNYFNDIEVAKRARFNKLNTGNNGSSCLNPLFDFASKTGFHSGYNQYDSYNYTLDSIKFYNSKRTFSDLYFSQILGNQSNFEVGAFFGQQFKGNTKLSVNYRRVLQIGLFNNQGTRTTNFATAVVFYAAKNKLRFIPGFIINNNNEKNNGGIDTSGIGNRLDESIFALRNNVPVKLTDAATRYAYTTLYLISEYGLKSIGQDSFQSSFGHKILYMRGTNKFSDVSINNKRDSSYYNALNYVIDARGLRNYAAMSQISNEFFITGSFKWASGRLSITHDHFNFQNIQQTSADDITVKFKGNVKVGKAFLLNTEALLGLGSNAGTFSLKGNTDIKVGKSIVINANAELFRSQVAANQNFFYVNEEPVYTNDYSAPFGSKLKASLYIKALNTSVTVGQILVNNFIYRNGIARPIQDAFILSSSYIEAFNKIKLWKINLETSAFTQSINKAYLPVPNQYIKSTLYFESLLFRRVMLLRFGGEYRYIPKFNRPSYDAVTGSYYNAFNNDNNTNYNGLDLFLAAKVSKFRIFVKYENVFFALNKKLTYLTENHPLFDSNIRFGIRWILVD